MEKLLNQLILVAGAWQKNENPVIEQQFSILFEELKQLTGLSHVAAEQLFVNHISGEMAA